MDLICPFYDEHQSYMTSELEQYDIYRVCLKFQLNFFTNKQQHFIQVTEKEYQTCYLNQFSNDPLTRRVITCNSPYDVMKYTLNFRSYLPIPNGFEFRANQTYYFLSTSSNHQQCNKLQILVHDYRKCSSSLLLASVFLTRPTTMSMFCLIALIDRHAHETTWLCNRTDEV